jgi:hypothetical protein
MATEITADGHVIAPLNIAHPTPSFDLKGFQWASIGELSLGPPPKTARSFELRDGQEPLSEDQPPASGERNKMNSTICRGDRDRNPNCPSPFHSIFAECESQLWAEGPKIGTGPEHRQTPYKSIFFTIIFPCPAPPFFYAPIC